MAPETKSCVPCCIVGKVNCQDILKFNGTDTNANMLQHVQIFIDNISKFFMLRKFWHQQHQKRKRHVIPMYEVSEKRKQTNYFKIFICIKNMSFFSIRIIGIPHFISLTTWF